MYQGMQKKSSTPRPMLAAFRVLAFIGQVATLVYICAGAYSRAAVLVVLALSMHYYCDRMAELPSRGERAMIRQAKREILIGDYRQARTRGCTRPGAWLFAYARSRSLNWPWSRY